MPIPIKNTRWFAWCQLVRLPNAFTVVADVLAGAAVARGSWLPWPLVVALVIATLFLYWSGMILNDVNDVAQDRLQNRERPLVDGRITLRQARWVGYGLIVASLVIVMAMVTAVVSRDSDVVLHPWRSLSTVGIAFGLAVFILLYDSRLKATIVGPWIMGLCRVASILIGLSIGWWLSPAQAWWSPHFWMLALGHGIYVTGITWAARREAEAYRGWLIPFGWGLSLIGIGMLAAVPLCAPESTTWRINPTTMYPIVIGLLALPWARRAVTSIASPSPPTLQGAVKQAILSIIFFDAVVVLQFSGTWPAIAVCSLILPAIAIGKFFRST